jgi:hypothetical protein
VTKLLEKAIAEVRKLPDDRQDEAAEVLLAIASQDAEGYRLSSEQLVDLEERLSAPPDHATEGEVAAVFRRILG